MPTLVRGLRLTTVAVGLAVSVFLTHSLHRQYAQSLADAEQRAINTAQTLARHAERTFETVDTYLSAVVSLTGPRAGSVQSSIIHAALHDQFERSRGLNNIVLTDRDGMATVEAIAFPARTYSLRDQDYFQVLRDRSKSEFVVGRPIVGPLGGNLQFPVARRINGPNGDFAGVVVALIGSQAFQSVYNAIDNGPGAALSLWRADGTLLVRAPWAPDLIGRNFASGPNYWLHVPTKDSKPFWSTATTDGIDRVFAFGFLDDYPLYVSAAVSRDDALAGWRGSALTQAIVAGGLALVLIAALLLLAREVERRQHADMRIRESKARLRASEERLALALDSGSDGLWDWDLTTNIFWLSDRWYRMLGYEVGDLEPHLRTWPQVVHPDDERRARETLHDHLRGRTPLYECEYRLRSKNGSDIWVLTRGKVVNRNEAGRALRIVGTQIDVTQRKAAEQQIAHMATHDGLTGLPNRVLFHNRLNHALVTTKRHGGSFAVLACDLDRFKMVNDSLGHPAGDELLRVVADRLRSVIRDGDTVARVGGDEFTIIVNRADVLQSVSLVAQRVIDAVRHPVEIDGHSASVGVSIGIALGDDASPDVESLLKNADSALYQAKAAGRNRFSFHEPGMDAVVATRRLLERDLRDAVHRGGFVLHYQPIVNLADEKVSGCEALLRWQHPTRGAISPAEFIPLAEETGLIVALGEWAIREACQEAASWNEDLRVAVNVSAVQFQQPGLEQIVLSALVGSGLSPHRLELEITESMLMQDSEAAIASLHRLKGLGIRIALDDFGTGFSSLSYLRRFPFDKIKIDRSFIRDIGNPDTAAIVRAIVSIGARLGATITAEGVETQGQLEHVRGEGCTEVQGFFYSRPLPVADALKFAHEQRSEKAA